MTSLRTFFRLIVGLLLLVGSTALPAQAQHAAMLQQVIHPVVPGIGNLRTATDADGNTYYVGCWTKRCAIDGTTLTAAATDSSVNLYVVKIAPTGRLLWAQKAGAEGATDIPFAIAADPAGTGVYVSGTSGKAFRIGAGAPLDSAGTFLFKLDATTGAVAWSRLVGTRDYSVPSLAKEVRVNALVATTTGLYLSGTATNTDSLDAVRLLNGRTMSMGYVARCSPTTGRINVAWNCATSTFQPTYVNMGALAVQTNGEVVAVGSFSGDVQFGADGTPPVLTSQIAMGNTLEGFIVHITLSPTGGSTQWILPGLAAPSALLLDAQNNMYIGGNSNGFNAIGTRPIPISGLYFARLSPLGRVDWLQTTTAAQFNDLYAMASGPDGRIYATGNFSTSTIQFGSHTVVNSPSRTVLPYLTCFTPTGNFEWARGLDNPNTNANLAQGVGVDAQNRVYMGGFGVEDVKFDDLLGAPQSAYLVRFDPGVSIGGRVYLDQNGNGTRDAGEPPFPRTVLLGDGTAALAASNSVTGGFTIYADTGSYTVQLMQVPAHFTVTEGASGYVSHLPQYGQADTARVFGLAPVAGAPDLRVTLTAYTRARVGRATYYRATVENVGTVPVSGADLTIHYDAVSQFVGSDPLPATHVGSDLTWHVPALAPAEVQNYDLATNLPINITVGTPITILAALTNTPADLVPLNNRDTLRQVVVGSADPNDIQVNYSRLTPQQVARGTSLDYMIRFQNIGTDTAFAVTIQDSLPASLLQLGTVELVAQSHNCQWRLDAQGHLNLMFPGIKLPHRNVNAVGSMGFVRFRVVPLPTLAPGDLIPNQAHITFDYNAPISTNEVTTLVQNPNGLVAAPGAAASWSLYPNPATTEGVTLTANVLTAGRVQVLVTDALGRPVQQETATVTAGPWSHAVSAQGLAPGLYLVRLTLPGGGSTSRKLVVR